MKTMIRCGLMAIHVRIRMLFARAHLISSGNVDASSAGPGGSPGGAFFIGFVADERATDITQIVFLESDSITDFSDSNIGFATLRFAPVPVPVPLSFLLFASGWAALFRLAKAAKSHL